MLLSRRPQARAPHFSQPGANSTSSSFAAALHQRRYHVPTQLQPVRSLHALSRRPRRTVVVAGLLGGGGPRKPLSGTPSHTNQKRSIFPSVLACLTECTSCISTQNTEGGLHLPLRLYPSCPRFPLVSLVYEPAALRV